MGKCYTFDIAVIIVQPYFLPMAIAALPCTCCELQVDVDLADEGDAKKVSRKQAHLCLSPSGKFTLTNTGRRTIHVNGVELTQHESIHLDHLSLLDLAGIRLLFMVNQSAVRRLVTRSQNLVL